jgi:hypothetical protein
MTMTAGSYQGYFFFNLYTFDNNVGSPQAYTNRFDYQCTRGVENFANEATTVLQAGYKYLIYAKDSGKYLPNATDSNASFYASSSFPGQPTTQMLNDPYDIYTDIPHIPFNYVALKSQPITVMRIKGADGTFNCNPLYIAGTTTSYLSNGQMIMIQGTAFANGTIVYPPYTSGNLYTISGAPVVESDSTVSFKLVALTGESLVTSPTSTTLSTVAIAGTAGQFSCAATQLKVGQLVAISGSNTGTGTISGYVNPTTYVIGVAGTTTFTLFTPSGAAIVTTVGTTSGLTFTSGHAGTGLIFFVNPSNANDTYISQMVLSTSTTNPGIPLGITVDSMGFNGIDENSSNVNFEYTLTY